MLQRLDIAVGQPFGHGLNGLALAFEQQAPQPGCDHYYGATRFLTVL
jgi:hypothetical protein